MDDDASKRLLARWQAGDASAAAELFGRYADRLIALVRPQLSARLGRRLDPEDVLQSAFRSFFVGARAGRYELERGGDLWRLLVAITLHKLQNQAARHTAAKRGLASEQSLGPHGGQAEQQALAREPSPVEALLLSDEVEQLTRRLPLADRRILELRLQGSDVYEIARHTSRSVATVYRVLERIKQHLRRGQDEAPA